MYALSYFYRGWWFWTGSYHTHEFCTTVSRVCQWLINDDRPTRRDRKERSREINCPNLRFHVILNIRDTSSAGWTHSCILDKRQKEPCKINCPSLGFCGVSSLQTSWKWPRLCRPYQMPLMNANILNKISFNTPWSGMHWLLLLLPQRANNSKTGSLGWTYEKRLPPPTK